MGYGLWAMGYGLWAMGYGLWAHKIATELVETMLDCTGKSRSFS
jgi:hypothetical protein